MNAEETARAIERELGDGWTMTHDHGSWLARLDNITIWIVNLDDHTSYTSQQVCWLANDILVNSRSDSGDQIS